MKHPKYIIPIAIVVLFAGLLAFYSQCGPKPPVVPPAASPSPQKPVSVVSPTPSIAELTEGIKRDVGEIRRKLQPTPPVTRQTPAKQPQDAQPSPTPDFNTEYNAARLARGLTTKLYFGGQTTKEGRLVEPGRYLIVHDGGATLNEPCMAPVDCVKCLPVKIKTYEPELSCRWARERYR